LTHSNFDFLEACDKLELNLSANLKFMIEKFLTNYGDRLVSSIFGAFVIYTSFYGAVYSDYGDLLGISLRSEPIWGLLGFGILIIIAGFFHR